MYIKKQSVWNCERFASARVVVQSGYTQFHVRPDHRIFRILTKVREFVPPPPPFIYIIVCITSCCCCAQLKQYIYNIYIYSYNWSVRISKAFPSRTSSVRLDYPYYNYYYYYYYITYTYRTILWYDRCRGINCILYKRYNILYIMFAHRTHAHIIHVIYL